MNKQKTQQAAVFLDRDGTINEDRDYIGDVDDVILIEGAAEAIKRLNNIRVPVIVITNQSGIGRGFYAEAELRAVNHRLMALLKTKEAHIEGLYYCPHLPQDKCGCRKPETALLQRAAQEHSIDLSKSVMIGDKNSDMELGRRAGTKTILVLTGYGEVTRKTIEAGVEKAPDYIAEDLEEAVDRLLSDCKHFGKVKKNK